MHATMTELIIFGVWTLMCVGFGAMARTRRSGAVRASPRRSLAERLKSVWKGTDGEDGPPDLDGVPKKDQSRFSSSRVPGGGGVR